MLRKLFVGVAAIGLVGLGYFLSLSFQTLQGKKPGGPPGAMGPGAPGGGAAMTGGGPTSRPTSQPAQAPTVEVAQLVERNIRERVVGNGVILPDREVEVIARVEGMIESIHVEAGQSVTDETVLCRIDERALLLAVTSATTDSEEAKKSLETMSQLRQRNAATQQEYEAALFRSQRTQALLDEANLRLSYARPKSPFVGVVTHRHVEEGQHVRPGDLMFAVADFSPLRMRIFLPERDVARVEVGQDVELRRETTGPVLTVGRVERISRVVDRESLTVEVTLEFDYDGSVDGFRPGSFARVDIITRRHPRSLVVPRGAVREDSKGRPFVFRVDRESKKLQKIPVEARFRDDRIVAVVTRRDPAAGYDDALAPLAAGDAIVVVGARNLQAGSRVTIYREVDVVIDPLTEEPAPAEGSGSRG